MADRPPSRVLGSLPQSRPHRRSEKRGDRASEPTPQATPKQSPAKRRAGATQRPVAKQQAATAKRRAAKQSPGTAKRSAQRSRPLRQPPQPHGTPAAKVTVSERPAEGTHLVATAVQAVAELAEIGLSVSARALRGALSRLPRP
jgi:hypothetical protein